MELETLNIVVNGEKFVCKDCFDSSKGIFIFDSINDQIGDEFFYGYDLIKQTGLEVKILGCRTNNCGDHHNIVVMVKRIGIGFVVESHTYGNCFFSIDEMLTISNNMYRFAEGIK
jgi:hypothetical protein